MAWQTPKTDWDTNPKVVEPVDFNRIEGNIDFLKADIETKKGIIVNAINQMGFQASMDNTYQELADILLSIPNRSGETQALSMLRSGSTIKLLPSDGYRDGIDDYVTHNDVNDIESNIRYNVSIRGLTGTFTGDATAVDGDIVIGKTAYALGAKITGSGKRKASGTATSVVSGNDEYISVSGLDFKPKIVIALTTTSGYNACIVDTTNFYYDFDNPPLYSDRYDVRTATTSVGGFTLYLQNNEFGGSAMSPRSIAWVAYE
jgi:hypothetical protein